jgi:cytochrome b pre-mRNA-processing protein 3
MSIVAPAVEGTMQDGEGAMLRRWLGSEGGDDASARLYRTAVGRARDPAFYSHLAVADTPDGRFDLIALHVALLLRRLHHDRRRTDGLAQALFDHMFADMDQNLREMGVGDLGVGKRVKAMAEGFYGRLAAYDRAIAAGDGEAVALALARNLYRKSTPEPWQLRRMADYVFGCVAELDAQPVDALLGGRARFAPVPARESGS